MEERFLVTLRRAPDIGFGIAIKEIKADDNTSIFISDVVEGGPAEGLVELNDIVVTINGIAIDNVGVPFTIQLLRKCIIKADIIFRRKRRVPPRPLEHLGEREPDESNYVEMRPQTSRAHGGAEEAMIPQPSRAHGGMEEAMRPQPSRAHGGAEEAMIPQPSRAHGGMEEAMRPQPSRAHGGMEEAMRPQPSRAHGGMEEAMIPQPSRAHGGMEEAMRPQPSRAHGGMEEAMRPQPSRAHGGMEEAMIPQPSRAHGGMEEAMRPQPSRAHGGMEEAMRPQPGRAHSGVEEAMRPQPSRAHSGMEEAMRPQPSRAHGGMEEAMRPQPSRAHGGMEEAMRPQPSRAHSEPVYDYPRKHAGSPSDASMPSAAHDGCVYRSNMKVVKFKKTDTIGLTLAGGNDVGLFISRVVTDSPAARGGLEEGDHILTVNEFDFENLIREEAVLFLMDLPLGKEVTVITKKTDKVYQKILRTNAADRFHIRTHFQYQKESKFCMDFDKGEVLRVVDSLFGGTLGSWLAVRLDRNNNEIERGVIPNQHRAKQLCLVKQPSPTVPRPAGGSRVPPFWKFPSLKGNSSRNLEKIQPFKAKFPPYERIVLQEAGFLRPVVIFGPIADVAREKLTREDPGHFQRAKTEPRDAGTDQRNSGIISLHTVKQIIKRGKHAVLDDVSLSAVERLNYAQWHPIVVFLSPDSKKGVERMRSRLCPESRKSSTKLYKRALELRKNQHHLFTKTIQLNSLNDGWHGALKDTIRHHQKRQVWVSEGKADSGPQDALDVHDDSLSHLSAPFSQYSMYSTSSKCSSRFSTSSKYSSRFSTSSYRDTECPSRFSTSSYRDTECPSRFSTSSYRDTECPSRFSTSSYRDTECSSRYSTPSYRDTECSSRYSTPSYRDTECPSRFSTSSYRDTECSSRFSTSSYQDTDTEYETCTEQELADVVSLASVSTLTSSCTASGSVREDPTTRAYPRYLQPVPPGPRPKMGASQRMYKKDPYSMENPIQVTPGMKLPVSYRPPPSLRDKQPSTPYRDNQLYAAQKPCYDERQPSYDQHTSSPTSRQAVGSQSVHQQQPVDCTATREDDGPSRYSRPSQPRKDKLPPPKQRYDVCLLPRNPCYVVRPPPPNRRYDVRPPPPNLGYDVRTTPPNLGYDVRPTPPILRLDVRPKPPNRRYDVRPPPPNPRYDVRSPPPILRLDVRPKPSNPCYDVRPPPPNLGYDVHPPPTNPRYDVRSPPPILRLDVPPKPSNPRYDVRSPPPNPHYDVRRPPPLGSDDKPGDSQLGPVRYGKRISLLTASCNSRSPNGAEPRGFPLNSPDSLKHSALYHPGSPTYHVESPQRRRGEVIRFMPVLNEEVNEECEPVVTVSPELELQPSPASGCVAPPPSPCDENKEDPAMKAQSVRCRVRLFEDKGSVVGDRPADEAAPASASAAPASAAPAPVLTPQDQTSTEEYTDAPEGSDEDTQEDSDSDVQYYREQLSRYARRIYSPTKPPE